MNPPIARLAVGLLLLGAGSLRADDAPDPAELERCASIESDDARLDCFDAITGNAEHRTPVSFLDRHWDLRGEGRPLQPWAHRPNYVLAGRWTNQANEAPFQEAVGEVEGNDPDVQSVEAKFQISFKTKLIRGLLGGPADLWFGYTQQSHFQVYNGSESRPFRETNYEPELIVAFPLRRSWGSWTWRMIGLGAVHQSNGRSEPLSRSWNRVYAMLAGERGDVSVQIRPWVRVDSDDPDDDDNPQIEDHIGRLEALVQWLPGDHALQLRALSNLETDGHKGSFQADWFFPIGSKLSGLLQVFTGYGESLIDYDHRQTTVGLGVLLFDPFHRRADRR